MGKQTDYSWQPENSSSACKARGSHLRVSYKNTRETAMAIRGLTLKRAQQLLTDVIAHKDAIPFHRHCGNIGRHAMGKKYKVSGNQCRWPEKSCRFLLDLLTNAASNADNQSVDPETLVVRHIQVQRAPKIRRRTYRAHGRIGPYMASPCHIELILVPKSETVAKATDASVEVARPKRRNRSARITSGTSAADL